MATTAQAISRQLRAAGFKPMTDRRKEGLLVTGGHAHQVYVSSTVDAPSAARRMSADAEGVLVELGYAINRVTEFAFYASR